MNHTIENFGPWKLVAEDSHFTKWVKECGDLCHDTGHCAIIAQYVKDGDVCIDAGANIGTITLAMQRMNAEVYAFEPYQPSFNCLSHNTAQHNGRPVHLFNKALGARKGRMALSLDGCGDNIGMTHGVAGKGIEIISIDSLKLERLNFIKLDCEGMEIEVLEGAKKTIAKYKPIIDVEVNELTLARNNYTPAELLYYIEKMGYELRQYAGDSIQADYICIPK